jgi:amidase
MPCRRRWTVRVTSTSDPCVSQHISTTVSPTDDVATVLEAAAQAMTDVEHNTPGCGWTMELLWESLFLGGDRGGGFEQDLQAIGATDPSEELAEFLRQAREVDFLLSEARRRFVAIDEYRIEALTVMADYDVVICPAMPTPAKPHHHGLVEITDFSHVMVHNLTGWPAAVGVRIVARPWQDSTALAVAGFVEKVFGGWRPPPPVAA